MNASIQKKATMFRLNVDLIERLKEMAKREHRSLNNFVECVLLDVAYNEPNEVKGCNGRSPERQAPRCASS